MISHSVSFKLLEYGIYFLSYLLSKIPNGFYRNRAVKRQGWGANRSYYVWRRVSGNLGVKRKGVGGIERHLSQWSVFQ